MICSLFVFTSFCLHGVWVDAVVDAHVLESDPNPNGQGSSLCNNRESLNNRLSLSSVPEFTEDSGLNLHKPITATPLQVSESVFVRCMKVFFKLICTRSGRFLNCFRRWYLNQLAAFSYLM